MELRGQLQVLTPALATNGVNLTVRVAAYACDPGPRTHAQQTASASLPPAHAQSKVMRVGAGGALPSAPPLKCAP